MRFKMTCSLNIQRIQKFKFIIFQLRRYRTFEFFKTILKNHVFQSTKMQNNMQLRFFFFYFCLNYLLLTLLSRKKSVVRTNNI